MTGDEFFSRGRELLLAQRILDGRVAEATRRGLQPGDEQLDELLDSRDRAAAELDDHLQSYLRGE